MEFLEDRIFKDLGFQLNFYKSYVDDSFLIIKKDLVLDFVSAFNSLHPDMSFTHEMEKDFKLSFLDVVIERGKRGHIKADWFHKGTWSGQYLNFNSKLSLKYKKNTFKVLMDKVMTWSDASYKTKNIDLPMRTLSLNNYGGYILNLNLRNYNRLFMGKNQRMSILNKSTPYYMGFPYVCGLFENISCFLRRYDIVVTAKPQNTLGQAIFTKLKFDIVDELKRGLVHQIDCICGKSCIGETKKYFSSIKITYVLVRSSIVL